MTNPTDAVATEAAASQSASSSGSVAHGLPPGTELHDGKFRIVRALGQGGFGITYLAVHALLNIQVAIKEYFPRQFASRVGTHVVGSNTADNLFEWGLGRFLEEAERQARLRHPHIAAVTDYFKANDTAYMVLEYVEGQSFEDWLVAHDSKPPTAADVAEIGTAGFQAWRAGRGDQGPTQAQLDQIFAPLLDAVAFVHAQGIVHRDIKPDNIMIRQQPDSRTGALVPVLLDFGAARAAFAGEIAKRRMTAIISDGYSPLEQYQSDATAQGTWSDIYSLGATLYRAVTGQRPASAVDRTANSADPMLVGQKALRRDYRGAFLSTIDAATRMEPKNRPASVERLRQGLFARTFTQIPPADDRKDAKPSAPGIVRFVTRHPQRAVALAIPLLALLSGAMIYVLSAAPGPAGKKISADKSDPLSKTKAATDPSAQSTGEAPIEVRLHVAKTTYKVGDLFKFSVATDRDCHFLVYTISADDKVELHDPTVNSAFMGEPLLKAGERREIPVPGAPGIARINPPAGSYEIGAVCGREALSALGLAGAQLTQAVSGGRRSFSFALDKAVSKIDRNQISRTAVTYAVTP